MAIVAACASSPIHNTPERASSFSYSRQAQAWWCRAGRCADVLGLNFCHTQGCQALPGSLDGSDLGAALEVRSLTAVRDELARCYSKPAADGWPRLAIHTPQGPQPFGR
jgi:hypothetical protein